MVPRNIPIFCHFLRYIGYGTMKTDLPNNFLTKKDPSKISKKDLLFSNKKRHKLDNGGNKVDLDMH